MDCMRLFTKEDVLDGDEKPVSHPSITAVSKRCVWGQRCHQQSQPRPIDFSHQSFLALSVMSFRHAVAAEPENDV